MSKSKTGMKIPGRRKICAAIQMQIDTLRDSFTDRFGPTKGQIRDVKIRDEIECLKAAKQLVSLVKGGGR